MDSRLTSNQNLAIFHAAATARAPSHRSGNFVNECDAALLLEQHHRAAGGVKNLKLTHDLLERLALAGGMEDGLSGLGVDAGSFDYTSQNYLRSFCGTDPIPFSMFDGIRRTRHQVALTAVQEEYVMKSFEKIVAPPEEDGAAGTSSSQRVAEISKPLPVVSALFDQRCPELRNSMRADSLGGATYLMLAALTGHVDLCRRCLKAGANPNNFAFLCDKNAASDEFFHGYSPMFIAVLAEQVEMLDLMSQYGGSIHVYDRWGRTPLHAAVAIGSADSVRWLLLNGAPRYVTDHLNLTPAESIEEGYLPDLMLPNVALTGAPRRPTLAYFQKVSGLSHMTKEERAAAAAATAAAVAAGKNIRTDPMDDSIDSCHCHSGRPVGYCGCVDDMYLRWSVDRLNTSWSPGVDYYALAQRQEQELQRRPAVSRRRK